MTNYTITKQKGNKVEVTNSRSERTFSGTLFSNGTKVALDNWGGRNALSPKIVTVG